jgi:hypothetical protein
MNWNPFKKKQEEESEAIDPTNITLSDLKPGFVLDYDLKTWQVTAHHYYEYDGDRVDEWELSCGDDTAYLDREEDDGITWTLTRKIRISDIENNIRAHMRENDDPPDEITYNNKTYHGESSAVGQFYKDGEEPSQEFITWDYLDDSEKHTLSLEQWGDDEYDASVGEIVEDYQFTNILPGG